jgi:hypothetical protein
MPILTLVFAERFMLEPGLVTAEAARVRAHKGQGVGSKAGLPDPD